MPAAVPRAHPDPHPACDHCGTECPTTGVAIDTPSGGSLYFCCLGCRAVFQLLSDQGLDRFYRLEQTPGARVGEEVPTAAYGYLDTPEIGDQLVRSAGSKACRVELQVPAIHCVACVWLLENLYRLEEGIGECRVNFPRKTVTVTFDPERVRLSRIAYRLSSLGYPPALRLTDLEERPVDLSHRRLLVRIGVAGFASGNIMLMSFPAYFGLEGDGVLGRWIAFSSVLLALPVVLYSASDYWRAAWMAIRMRTVTIDVPIALGLAALFGQSLYELGSGAGEGYLDSLSGLVFFLLCGRWFQQHTFDRLRFDRDYTDYFPLAAAKISTSDGEQMVPLNSLEPGDRILVRNGELIPADGTLRAGAAAIDYSFVTGESEPVPCVLGGRLLAGGRQVGGAIEVEAKESVRNGTLASLWTESALANPSRSRLESATDRISRWFTSAVLAIAGIAAVYWLGNDPSLALRAFVSVLIVACPCALALAAPFATGTALRELARMGLFVRSSSVVEALARLETLIFDKTGTLTRPGGDCVEYRGRLLSALEQRAISEVLVSSIHPFGRAVHEWLGVETAFDLREYQEVAGAGCQGRVGELLVVCGSLEWLEQHGAIGMPIASDVDRSSTVHVAIDRCYRGHFVIAPPLRDGLGDMFTELGERYSVAVSSGDSDRDRARLEPVLGDGIEMAFRQSPKDKLELVEGLAEGGAVAMIGDGLNDAGALRGSDVGIAVADDVSTFAPACDAILDSARLRDLPRMLQFARRAMTIVGVCFVVSVLYNVFGIGLAVTGRLAPVVSAILMPLSSVTVVGLASGLTKLAAFVARTER